MAEAVLFNIAEEIIIKLGSHVFEEIGLWWGVKYELEKLKNTVSTIQAVLLDAEEQYSENNQVKIWLGNLREVVYDADDLLDDFSTEILRRKSMTSNRIMKEVRLFFSHSNQLVYGFKMVDKIKHIRHRLVEIAANRNFHLDERRVEVENSVMIREREQTHSSLPQVVIGREDDKEKIIEFLLCSSSSYGENVSTITIVGIGGLGKTTLAQLVYNDEKVKTNFELKLWVCVSHNFDVKVIVKKILECVTRVRQSNLVMETLKNLLHEKIDGKKYLIVLDDVWNENLERWSDLKNLLSAGAKGSKIIITTRLKKVTQVTRSIEEYELQGLSEGDSWLLFKQIAFKQGQVPSPSHVKIGKEIVAKCVGVPLAIKTIGGLLYFKDTESEWLSFKNNELSKVNQRENCILQTLKLSYNHLPSHLKHCFAYCSLFPKDYAIDAKTLIHLWMAQGYITLSNSRQSYNEEMGFAQLKDLVSRCFFKEVEKDKWGNIKTCKMHDLMHDLAKSVAGEEIISILKSNISSSLSPSSSCVGKITARHLSFDYDFTLFNARKARTLISLKEWWRSDKEQQEECHEKFSKYKCLRVLALAPQTQEFKEVPHYISKFKHLRYLDLSRNDLIKKLPNSITKLLNLQVLKLDGCSELEKLPKKLKILVNLTHLGLKGCFRLTHMPSGIGKLTRLENLSTFVVAAEASSAKYGGGGLCELNGLNNLRGDLTIENLRFAVKNDENFNEANLKEKQHLQYLGLQWTPLTNQQEDDVVEKEEMAMEALKPHQNLKELFLFGYRGIKYPSWLLSLTNLVEISFWNCPRIQFLPPFDQLPFLESLLIDDLTALEFIDIGANSNFFPSLNKLKLWNCPNLKGFCDFETTCRFPCLSCLEIESCPNLTSIPTFQSLEELKVSRVGMKSLEHLLKLTISASESALSRLKVLEFQGIEDLEFPAEEFLESLASLQHLAIRYCPRIATVFKEDDENVQWQALKSLSSLDLEGIQELVSLPIGLQYVSNLQSLRIQWSPELISLPEWMPNLTSLQSLYVYGCPLLSERCRDKSCKDWPKIARIPDIEIEKRKIQLNSCYLISDLQEFDLPSTFQMGD